MRSFALTTILAPLVLALAVAPACGGPQRSDAGEEEEGPMAFTMTSTAFTDRGTIPALHTCDAEDLSPELSWDQPPVGTRSLALVCDDPDAPMGTWVHWVLYDIPPETSGLPEGVPATERLSQPGGARQGKNDFGRVGYGGPCPPPGKPHRYFFRLYALDALLELEPGATKGQLEKAMEGHVLGAAGLVGTYARGR
jgi:Raf kinase inhibitor-like YbhB/YbcL family protein